MMDSHETNLPPEETGKLEETQAPVNGTNPENESKADTAEHEVIEMAKEETTPLVESVAPTPTPQIATKQEIVNKLKALAEKVEESSRSEVDSLKQAFYKLHRAEVEEQKKEFLENGGVESEFIPSEDEIESQVKELLNVIKEKKANLTAEEERQREANYALKLQLIDQLKALINSQEDFNKLYNEFKSIQAKWKETKQVPQEHAKELWKEYQLYTEQFYDIIKINNQFRDYDFKKNLELKTALCETVERLDEEPDVISAFHQLQKLHGQWREIGPVAKEIREDIWNRFKAASSIINKKHQAHFDKLKEREQENLEEKTAICEQIEAIDYDSLKSFKDWDSKTKEIIGLQDKWKTIGYAPKRQNIKIFERFRAACDFYFSKKAAFYKSIKEDMERNMEQKKVLCEKAEQLKDSTDWKKATEQFIALQNEWKTIGPVARKYSDTIWKRFITACDYFFEQKNKVFASHKSEEQENLTAKKELIDKIINLDVTTNTSEALETLKEYIAEWNAIGFVPFKEKDKIYKVFHAEVDKKFEALNIDRGERKIQQFRSNLSGLGEQGRGKILNERDRLMRTYERMKNELQTYENNIGFLSISSKGGGGLVKEMEHKIEKLKKDMELVVQKINAIDENLEQ